MPVNYALLFGFTVCAGVSIASLTAGLTPESLLLSIGLFCNTLSGLWIAALFVKDNLKLMIYLLIGLFVVCLVQISMLLGLMMVGMLSSGLMILYGVLGVIAAGLYVIVDLVMIMAPGEISNDDYILGALMLYIDLLRLFLYILMIFATKK